MKPTIGLVLCLLSTTSFASETLLRCNIPFGELQEISIKRNGSEYSLTQLTNSGSMKTYPLSEKEWLSKKIIPKLSWGDKAIVTMTREGWVYKSATEYYVLDCGK